MLEYHYAPQIVFPGDRLTSLSFRMTIHTDIADIRTSHGLAIIPGSTCRSSIKHSALPWQLGMRSRARGGRMRGVSVACARPNQRECSICCWCFKSSAPSHRSFAHVQLKAWGLRPSVRPSVGTINQSRGRECSEGRKGWTRKTSPRGGGKPVGTTTCRGEDSWKALGLVARGR